MKWIKNLFLVTVPVLLVLFLLLELVFRFVIPATDPPMGYFHEKDKLYSFAEQNEGGRTTIGRFAEIRTDWYINNMHWNYPVNYDTSGKKPLVAVIGDSFIESFQVDTGKNYPALLRNSLGGQYEVYAFGKSGAPFSQYLHMARYVNRYFDPSVIIVNLVHNDFDESVKELKPEYSYFMQLEKVPEAGWKETTPVANPGFPQFKWGKRLLYKSALFRYFFLNLHVAEIRQKFSQPDPQKFEGNVDAGQLERSKASVFAASEYITSRFKTENSQRKLLFVIDGTREAIYKGDKNSSAVRWMNEMMDSLSRKYEIGFLDLSAPMEQEYRKTKRKFNSELDGHWDEYGHAFVSAAVLNYLKTNGYLADK